MPASSDSSPGSNPRAFSFGDLGRPRASSPRLLPPIKDPDPSELELDADDILESNDIDSFEMAAAEIKTFAAPPSAIEISDVEPFEGVEVEGMAPVASVIVPIAAPVAVAVAPAAPVAVAPPAPIAVALPAPVAVAPPAPVAVAPPTPIAVAAPVMRVDYTSPPQSTLIGIPPAIPPAPITSPLPLEKSVVPADHTQEMKGDTLAKVAAQASFLDGDIPDETQVIDAQAEQQASTQILVRADMPAALRGAPSRGRHAGQTPPPTSVHTPAAVLANTAAAWPNGRHPQASLAPVAVDARVRPTMASSTAASAAPAKSNGLLIGGLVFAAAALIGVVGVGGYLASRTISDKVEPTASTTAPEAVPAAIAAPIAAPVAAADPSAATVPGAPAPAADPAASPSAAGVDVSSLPSAPAKGAAPPHVATVSGAPRPITTTAPPPPPTGRAGAPLPPPGAVAAAPPPPVQAGGAAALPPPPSKAAPAAPAAAAAAASSTGNVNVDPKLRAVVVDGSFRRVNDGVVTLSCGTHRIKVGMNDPQTVNVPCGGSVSL